MSEIVIQIDQPEIVIYVTESSYSASGSAAWGAITGTLSNQTDLVAALAAKEATITAGTSSQYWRGDKTWQTLNTTAVTEGTNLYWTSARFDSAFAAKSTSDLAEGTNQYWTQARFNAAFTAKSTTDLSEGTNLYWTAARFNTAFAAKSTSDLSEGTNLYFTTARAIAAITATTMGDLTNSLTAKTTPVDADYVPLMDSAASNIWKKLSWSNIKATLKTYFDTLYQTILTAANVGDFIVALTGKTTPVDADTIILSDSAASDDAKKVTWANIKATLKTYFDGLYEALANKDASGGYAGLTLFKINFKNAANTFTSFFTNSNTAARTYTFPDKDMTVAGVDDSYFIISTGGTNGVLSPADSTTYYFSVGAAGNIIPNTTDTNFAFNLGYAFTIIGAVVSIGGNTTSGSTENNTFQIRNITQNSSSSVGSFLSNGSTTLTVKRTITGLNISVAAGDSICGRWDAPAYATNPAGARIGTVLLCKRA